MTAKNLFLFSIKPLLLKIGLGLWCLTPLNYNSILVKSLNKYKLNVLVEK